MDTRSRVWFHVLEKEGSMTPATVTERRTEQTTDKFNALAKGGSFAAWEQPQLFSEEVRAGFRSLRK